MAAFTLDMRTGTTEETLFKESVQSVGHVVSLEVPSLTAAFDMAAVGRLDVAVIAPVAAVDLQDAVVRGSISVVVGHLGVVTGLPLGQTNPCR